MIYTHLYVLMPSIDSHPQQRMLWMKSLLGLSQPTEEDHLSKDTEYSATSALSPAAEASDKELWWNVHFLNIFKYSLLTFCISQNVFPLLEGSSLVRLSKWSVLGCSINSISVLQLFTKVVEWKSNSKLAYFSYKLYYVWTDLGTYLCFYHFVLLLRT